MRRLGYALSVFVLVTAALIVPLPLVELAPGTATSVVSIVRLETDATTPINGDVRLLTVQVRTPATVDAVGAWLSPERELELRDLVIPPGVDESDYFRVQRQQFERSFRVAVAVGLRAAGEPVAVTTRPIVFAVLPGGPSDGLLAPGDVILEVDGLPVSDGDELIAALRDLQPGDPVELTVERDGEAETVTVTAARVPGVDRPAGIGVNVETIADDVELPFDVELVDESGIGGPSAGLAFALTVHDLVSPEDLVAGRTIAATGTIDVEGRVGTVGGIPEKVVAAEAAGAELVLVPAPQALEARAAADGRIRVVPVGTFAEALRVLRDDGAASGRRGGGYAAA